MDLAGILDPTNEEGELSSRMHIPIPTGRKPRVLCHHCGVVDVGHVECYWEFKYVVTKGMGFVV